MLRVGVLDRELADHLAVVLDRALLPAGGADRRAAEAEARLVRAQGHVDQRPGAPGRDLDLRRDLHEVRQRIEARGEILADLHQRGLRGELPEPAHEGVDGVHGPPADQLLDPVAELLELEREGDLLRIGGGHADDGVVAEEVGQRQGEHVQRVRLDRRAQDQQAAQPVDPLGALDPERVLQRVQRGDGVGRGADGADPRDDPLDLEVVLPLEERLVVAASLEDVHVHFVDRVAHHLDEDAAVPFDPAEVGNRDRPTARLHRAPPARDPSCTRRGRRSSPFSARSRPMRSSGPGTS